MRKFFLVLVVLGIVASVGYLLGTEDGRARRDDALAKVRKKSDSSDLTDAVELRDELADKAVSTTTSN
jgi:hypothetical protein